MNTQQTRLKTYFRKTNRYITCKNMAYSNEGGFYNSNNRKTTAVLPFDVEDMKILISAYDGYAQLLMDIERIFEVRPSGRCFEDLGLLKDLIARLSPIYVKDIPWEDQEIGYILDESELSLSEAAEKLMGVPDAVMRKNAPYFVIDARSMGLDTALLTDSTDYDHTAYLLRKVHMRLLAEAYDSYLRVREALNELFDSEEVGGDFHGLRNIETLMLIMSPQFTDGSERSRARLRKMFARRELSIDELVQQLMKLPIEKET